MLYSNINIKDAMILEQYNTPSFTHLRTGGWSDEVMLKASTEVKEGFNKSLIISDEGDIIEGVDDDYLYLLLDSSSGKRKAWSGRIYTSPGVEKIFTTYGDVGYRGSLGSYTVALLKVPRKGKFRICISGTNDAEGSYFKLSIRNGWLKRTNHLKVQDTKDIEII